MNYQSKRFPRTFVVGDAAHAFPPTGGLGVNTGIADAQNLAWKINAVEKSWASESLLARYSTERRPVAVANARQSVINQVRLRSLKAALRNPPSVSGCDPVEWKRRLHHELKENAEHFDSINLQLGYVYGEDEGTIGPCDCYTPRADPGARLPHTWISCAKEKISILDLVDGTSFVLFTSEESLDDLSQERVSRSSSVPIRTVRVGVDFQVLNDAWLDVVGLSTKNKGLLVRPDQHILGTVKCLGDLNRLVASHLRP